MVESQSNTSPASKSEKPSRWTAQRLGLALLAPLRRLGTRKRREGKKPEKKGAR